MSEPLALTGATTGDNVYAIARRQSDGAAWNATAAQWEQPTAENWPTYAKALAGATGGYWFAPYPAEWEGVNVEVTYQKQAGSSPADTDIVLGGEARFTNEPTGAYAITVQALDDITNAPLQGAKVRFTLNNQAATVTTDAAGHASLSLDPGTYTVSATAAGYVFRPGPAIIASDMTVTVAMSAYTITPPADPSLSRGLLITFDGQGQPLAACPIRFRMKTGPGAAGQSFPASTFTLTSDTHGHLLADLVRGATYEAHRGSGEWVSFPIPDADTFTLPEILSQPM